MQYRTGCVISGSFALQFLDRTFYPESDLDLYVESVYAQEVASWVEEEAGMGYVRVESSADSTEYDEGWPFNDGESDEELPPPVEIAPSSNVRHRVSTFVSGECGRKVQVISCNSPIYAILEFHSSEWNAKLFFDIFYSAR